MLVDALYEAGKIDAHKNIGASCHEASLFIDKEGRSLSHKKFYIECNLETDEMVSYMDSFKYYSYSDGKAYNYDTAPYSYALDITEATIDEYVNGDDDDDDQYYDEYHDRDCEDITYVHYHGREISCDSEDLEASMITITMKTSSRLPRKPTSKRTGSGVRSTRITTRLHLRSLL